MAKKLATLKKLPASMARGIGRIMVADSYLDLALSQIIYLLLGIGQKEGRLAAREPRAVERLELIQDLAHVHGITMETDMKLLREALQTSASNRDLVGHGVWFKRPSDGALLVRQIRGSWPKDDKGFRKSHRILPRGQLITEQNLADMLSLTESTTGMVEVLHREIEAGLEASPRKPQ